MYRFALRGRWLAGHFVVLALAALFVRLGLWQLDRHEQAASRNALIETRSSVPPRPLDALLPAGTADGSEALYRRVMVAGRYDRGREAIVPFGSLNGRRGAYVLTPLVTRPGHAVVVNRGWVPGEGAEASVPAAAAAPLGAVRVVGLALPGGAGSGRVVDDASGGRHVVTRVDVRALDAVLPYDLAPVHVQLERQAPRQPGALPRPLPPPVPDDGPHLSYAVQWFVFAAIGVGGWPILLRREARLRALGRGGTRNGDGAADHTRRRRPRGRDD